MHLTRKRDSLILLCFTLLASARAQDEQVDVEESADGADVDCNSRPAFVDPRTCCAMPKLVSDELMEECKPPRGNPNMTAPEGGPPGGPPGGRHGPGGPGRGPWAGNGPPHHRHHHIHPCMAECFFNTTEIFVDNKLNEAKLKAYLEMTFKDKDAEFIPVLEKAFKTCSEKKPPTMDENKMNKMRDNGRRRCSFRSAMLMGCAMMEAYQNCPTGVWSNTQQCNDNREFMKKCHKPMKDSEATAATSA